MFKGHCFLLSICATLIFVMGLVMIFNTSSAEVIDLELSRNTSQALFKQLSYGLVGFLLAYGLWKMGYQSFLSLSPFLLAIGCLLLILTLIPGIGKEVNGSRRWLGVGGFSFQPSEFVKYLVPAFFIQYVGNRSGKEITLKFFLKLVAIVGLPVLLIFIEPNNGTAGVIGLTIILMCVLTAIPLKYWIVPLAAVSLVGLITAFHLPYVAARIQVYLHPELDLQGKGHQPYQAKIAAGSGQVWGRGPGNSLQKLSYLPEAQNDYIAAIYAEEFGFIGISLLIFLYMVIGLIGFSIAYLAASRAGAELATAITFLFTFQAFMNLGVVSGLLPSTGLNLPLFSQGGTSLMANIMGLGLLLSIGMEPKERGVFSE